MKINSNRDLSIVKGERSIDKLNLHLSDETFKHSEISPTTFRDTPGQRSAASYFRIIGRPTP